MRCMMSVGSIVATCETGIVRMASMNDRTSITLWRTLLIACVSGAIGGLIVWIGQGHRIVLRPEGLTYAELAAVLLAAAALIVGVFGIAVGFLTIWGFKYFKQIAISEARKRVEQDLSSGESRALIQKIAQSVAASKVEQEFQNGDARKFIETQVSSLIVGAADRNAATAELAESRRQEQAKFPEDSDE